LDGGSKVRTPIKKAIRTIALLTKKISNLNFRSETEIIEAYEIKQHLKRIDSINRGKKFNELTELFDLKENCPFDKLTVKQAEQERLLWKLVDLERGQHE
jgi:hypothetical protein